MREAELRRAAGRSCTCGYLESGVAPASLCFDCGDRSLADWITEEKSLLARMPGYGADVAELLEDAARRQRTAIERRSNEPNAEAQWERNKAARRLSAVRRRHRGELSGVSLDAWERLAELVRRDPREQLRKDGKRFAKRGLGAAQLTGLGLDALEMILRKR
ncbi:hypothetical protein [Microbacterium sp.]|uniref:hypothetical protein n=1 Tax=Microbacterium sp. TaxID=51671 RepID=UPI0028A9C91B|nr:hypothetical protein [Microbacterium sp.]